MPAPDSSRDLSRPRVHLNDGDVEGLQLDGVSAFLGIPYAAPPTGDRRFLHPAPVEPWKGTLRADALGAPAMQTNPDLPAWLDPSPSSEDCLVLNVWTPSTGSETARPVMVWFHGGAYTYGSAGAPLYDGARLAAQGDVVVVSVNHRLNAFGYAWFGDLLPELADHGNPGQADLAQALRWVRANAGVFGGDAGNVTIFGESGGGGKIGALAASREAPDLYDKMIVQSGAFTMFASRAEGTECSRQLVAELGLAELSLQALQAIPADELRAAVDAVEARAGILVFTPVVDGRLIVDQPWSSGPLSRTAGIPLLIGSTRDEAVTFAPELLDATDDTAADLLAAFPLGPRLDADTYGQVLDGLREMSPGLGEAELAVAAATDLSFWASTREVVGRRAELTSPTFVYEFTWGTPCFGSSWAPHAGEIPYVFDNLTYATAWDGADSDDARAAADPSLDRYVLRDTVVAAWVAFARSGDPSTADLAWSAWTEAAADTMVLGGQSTLVSRHKEQVWDLIGDLPRGL